jgi:hypothetical protein
VFQRGKNGADSRKTAPAFLLLVVEVYDRQDAKQVKTIMSRITKKSLSILHPHVMLKNVFVLALKKLAAGTRTGRRC